mmetsp:Transcript_7925/g.48953  ORF Transcript_7925/g.48953 Transcript_7925/m.48953 type:complete len:225 (-) Transcript_7925:4675-5349(-)
MDRRGEDDASFARVESRLERRRERNGHLRRPRGRFEVDPTSFRSKVVDARAKGIPIDTTSMRMRTNRGVSRCLPSIRGSGACLVRRRASPRAPKHESYRTLGLATSSESRNRGRARNLRRAAGMGNGRRGSCNAACATKRWEHQAVDAYRWWFHPFRKLAHGDRHRMLGGTGRRTRARRPLLRGGNTEEWERTNMGSTGTFPATRTKCDDCSLENLAWCVCKPP